jgi:hypothetical protein
VATTEVSEALFERQLSAVTRRPVQHVDVPDRAARAAIIQAGTPAWMADQLVILWGELRRGAARPPPPPPMWCGCSPVTNPEPRPSSSATTPQPSNHA